MRDPIKIGGSEYLAVNAVVLCVSINGAGISIGLETKDKLFDLLLPISTGIVADLCRIMEVDDLADVGRDSKAVCVRALALVDWSNGVGGIAHLIQDFGLSAFDYYNEGNPKKGLLKKDESDMPPHGEEKLFYMSTLEPPPGLPWTLVPDPPHPDGYPPGYFHLINEDGGVLGLVKEPLASWITKKAGLATFRE